jgi:CSLREA domain-containing protein
MQHRLRFLLPLLVLAACSEDQSPTGPTESGDLAENHAPGHKVVNSLADPGNGLCNAAQCTLREAINDPASTEITFAAGLTGTITLARPGAGGGTLVIEKQLTITGPAGRIVIQRRATDPAFRIFRIGSGVSVTLTNLTIRGGRPPATGGGGIVNFGTLALTNCTVVGNSADFGGGLSNHQGMLTLTNSTVAQNSGGGISNRQGTLTLTNSTVARNSGGGISNQVGTLTLTTTTVEGNSGGGISDIRGRSTLTNARIVDNSGGGIITFRGGFTVTNSTISGNSAVAGGGISNTGGSLALTNSTISGNSADAGGGYISADVFGRVGARLTLTNSTVSGNSARFGGGISTPDQAVSVTLTNSTVARNSATQEGGGIHS